MDDPLLGKVAKLKSEDGQTAGERFLVADVSVKCGSPEHSDIQGLAWIAIVIYPVGNFVLDAVLLLSARSAIQEEKPTILSRATSFLHAEYKPLFFWWELIEAWKKIEGLVQSGERSWAEYFHEAVLYGPMASSAIMMLAGETSMVREIVSHSFVHIALGDSFVAAELEKVMNSSSFFWKVFLSLCHSLPPLHSLPPSSFRSPRSISL